MKSYRVFCFDGRSRIVSAAAIYATNDAEALASARRLMDGVRIEVWDLDRLAGRYECPEP